jgi:hypothetical protein
VHWHVKFEEIDYELILPLFWAGLREQDFPYQFIAREGSRALMEGTTAETLASVVPRLIEPFRTNMATRVPNVVVSSLKCMQYLLQRGTYDVGKALYPHFPHILQMFNVFHSWRQNLGDKIDYSQKDKQDIGELVSRWLGPLTQHSGDLVDYGLPLHCLHV